MDEPTSTSRPLEKFVRQRVPWFMIVTLTIYNLSLKSKGLSRHGYFHWRTHIVSFIDKNWDILFDPTMKRRKKWIGCVSGALSANSPDFFESGHSVFQESGWWKLKYSNQTPKFCYKIYEQLSQKRQQLRNDKRQLEDNYSSDISNPAIEIESKRCRRTDSEDEIDSCSRIIPYMGRKPKPLKQLNIVADDNENLNSVQTNLMDFLAESLSSNDLIFGDIPSMGSKDELLPLITPTDNCGFFDFANANMKTEEDDSEIYENGFDEFKLNQDNQDLRIPKTSNKFSAENVITVTSETIDNFQPRIVQVTNFQQLDVTSNEKYLNDENIKVEEDSSSENEEKITKEDLTSVNGHRADTNDEGKEDNSSHLEACEKSLFTKTPRREMPWLLESKNRDEDDDNNENWKNISDRDGTKLVPMSEYEEKEIYNKLRKIISLEDTCKLQIPSYIRRFYRKLVVREMKRTYSKSLFDLDTFSNKNTPKDNEIKTSILDRYQLISGSNYDRKTSFYARIAGSFQYELFESPYTSRILHPFIYRNKKCFPHWLKIMCEIQYVVNGETPTRGTLDFCYVRPNHIAAVNALLQTVFWPGIDMSECLSYPDFSVVALYKKLVVGCAFLVPDVGFNEAYISFMAVRPGWQRCGIATFMLYHLIQTCMSKDITLHVSATNPAVCLYQKFGFKIEEVILDFYEKYLPIDSKHSRHAFFLRLMR